MAAECWNFCVLCIKCNPSIYGDHPTSMRHAHESDAHRAAIDLPASSERIYSFFRNTHFVPDTEPHTEQVTKGEETSTNDLERTELVHAQHSFNQNIGTSYFHHSARLRNSNRIVSATGRKRLHAAATHAYLNAAMLDVFGPTNNPTPNDGR